MASISAEADELQAFAEAHDSSAVIDGFMFKVPREAAPFAAAGQAAEIAEALGRRACLYVKSVSASPAEAFLDEAENAHRAAESVLASACFPGRVEVVLDTFADVDRGYFARSGLVDRRYNPRPTGQVVGTLMSLLHGRKWRAAENLAAVDEEGNRTTMIDGSRLAEVDAAASIAVDLVTGTVLRWPEAADHRTAYPVALLDWDGASLAPVLLEHNGWLRLSAAAGGLCLEPGPLLTVVGVLAVALGQTEGMEVLPGDALGIVDPALRLHLIAAGEVVLLDGLEALGGEVAARLLQGRLVADLNTPGASAPPSPAARPRRS